MAVTVRVGGPLRSLLDGRRQVDVEGATVGEAMDHLQIRDQLSNESGELRPYITVHVNSGENIRRLEGFDTPVKDGDVVTILSAIGGG